MPRRRGRGEGSIEQLPSGNWRAALTVRTVDGKKDRISETFPTRTAAAQWLADKRAAHKFGFMPITAMTVGEYLSEWLTRRKPTVQAATADYYAGQVERLKGSAVAAVLLRKLTRQTVESVVPTWGSIDQQRKALTTLRTVLNEAVRDGLIPNNPARTARKPKADTKQVVFWTADEARALLDAAAGTYFEAGFWLALDSGMRPGELLGLHWSEVDTAAGTVRVVRALEDIKGRLRLKEPKTRKGRRTIRIGKGTCAALEHHRERMREGGRDVAKGAVFVGQRTGQLVSHNVFYQRYYKPAVKAAGIPRHRPYAMRHTSATLLLAAGVPINVVSERMGHEDIGTTLKHYIHCLPDSQEAAARAADAIFLAERPVRAEVKAPRQPHGESERPSTSPQVVDWIRPSELPGLDSNQDKEDQNQPGMDP